MNFEELKKCPYCESYPKWYYRRVLQKQINDYGKVKRLGCSNIKCIIKPYTRYSQCEPSIIDNWNNELFSSKREVRQGALKTIESMDSGKR